MSALLHSQEWGGMFVLGMMLVGILVYLWLTSPRRVRLRRVVRPVLLVFVGLLVRVGIID